MKAYILIYSGRSNPEKDLTEEEVKTLRELIGGLETKYLGPHHGHLGFSGYAANLEDIHVITSFNGYVKSFDSQGQATMYADTTGVFAYLSKIMTPIMIAHNFQESAN